MRTMGRGIRDVVERFLRLPAGFPGIGLAVWASIWGATACAPVSAASASGFGMHASFNLAAGGFEGEIEPNIRFGDAGTGFGLGAEFTKALTPELGWTTAAHLLFNALERGRDLPPPETEMGSWVNVPLLTGLRVSKGDALVAGYFQCQGGLNFGSLTESTFGPMDFNVDWATAFAFGLGAGIMIKQIHLGVRYFKALEAEHELTLSSGPQSDDEDLRNVAPAVVQLLIGVSFGR